MKLNIILTVACNLHEIELALVCSHLTKGVIQELCTHLQEVSPQTVSKCDPRTPLKLQELSYEAKSADVSTIHLTSLMGFQKIDKSQSCLQCLLLPNPKLCEALLLRLYNICTPRGSEESPE